jgi:hypothetical protein
MWMFGSGTFATVKFVLVPLYLKVRNRNSIEEDEELQPHEQYPELVYWKAGDSFTWQDTSLKYLGIKENQIVGEVTKVGKQYYSVGSKHGLKFLTGEIHYLKLKDVEDKTLMNNKVARKRQNIIEAQEVKKELQEDVYNIYLDELAEVKRKYLMEGTNAEV